MKRTVQVGVIVIQCLALLVLPVAGKAAADHSLPPVEEILIDLGDHQLTAWAWGDPTAELVLALPGSGASNTRYFLLGALVASSGYRFVAINQRGIAGSSGHLEGLTLHDYADDIARVIDYFGAPQAHLVGWALGNRIQRTVATNYPDKVATVTLLAAGGLVAPDLAPGVLNRLLSEPDLPLDEKQALARESLFAAATDDQQVRGFVEQLSYWPAARRSQQVANRAVPREHWWAGGDSPLLIVQGLEDRTAPPANGRQMQQTYGDRVTLVEISDAGHLMGYEKPEETARAIVEFLKRHSL
jgi:pimeloyl-ACP methyl ester carboxylesterase